MTARNIVVIGAGIVGVSAALTLQQDGRQVTLLDRQGPGSGASFGNAGAIVNGSSAPTAMPGIAGDVWRMLGKPLAPLTIRWSYLPRIAPWLLRFLLESRTSRVASNARNLHALTSKAEHYWRAITADSSLQSLLRQVGWLKVYETETAFLRAAHARFLMDELAVPYEVLDPADIHALEPRLARHFVRGVLQADSLQLINPGHMLEAMVTLFAARGGVFRRFDAQRLRHDADAVQVGDANEWIAADRLVIAAGAWSARFFRMLGDRIPLDAERGYHLMLPPETAGLLGRPVLNADQAFVLSPLENGLRLTSQVEFAGIDASPDYRRVRSLLPQAARMLPGVDTTEQSVWMGGRPSLPDSLPVIGPSPHCPRALYAFGHQHLGMTLAPVTAYLLADLVAGRAPRIDLAPYRADRF
jgi:D-amino-acid dehydrogenase